MPNHFQDSVISFDRREMLEFFWNIKYIALFMVEDDLIYSNLRSMALFTVLVNFVHW